MVHPRERKALAKVKREQVAQGCPRCGSSDSTKVAAAPHDMVSLEQCHNCGLVYPNPSDDTAYEKVDGKWQYIGAKQEHQSYQKQYAGDDYGEFGPI